MPGVMDLIWPSAFVVQSIHVVARLDIADILGRSRGQLMNSPRRRMCMRHRSSASSEH